MSANEVSIRIATIEDAQALLDIYTPYVESTAITFEVVLPSLEEFKDRIERVLKDYPYLVAEVNGVIKGYAYAGRFRPRAAYDWAIETSIYVDSSAKRQGVGGALHRALEKCLTMQGILNMYACIAYPEVEDEYLTKNSAQFHEHLGYRLVGEFKACGYKFDRWYNMLWMEKIIGDHDIPAHPIVSFQQIRERLAEECDIH